MESNNKLMWSIIESLNWGERSHNEHRAYEAIKMEFMRTYNEDIAKQMETFVGARWKDLDTAYDAHLENGGEPCGHFGGDDSYGDMMHHVIGMGEKEFKAVMKNIKRLDKINFVESFSYALPTVGGCMDDYEHLNEDYHVDHAKKAIKALAKIVASAKPLGHDKAMVVSELMSRFMAIVAGEYDEAFMDITFEADYDRFNNIHPEYHAMFSNYLFDAKKYLEVIH